MAKELWINDGGTVKQVNELHINDGGTVKQVNEGWINDSGTVKQFYPSSAVPTEAWSNTILGVDVTLSNGDLTATGANVGPAGTTGNVAVMSDTPHTTGKYYFEIFVAAVSASGGAADPLIGVADVAEFGQPTGPTNTAVSMQGRFSNNQGGSGTCGGFIVGDTICCATDAGARKVWIRKNSDAWAGGGDPALGTTPHKTLTSTNELRAWVEVGFSSQVVANFGGTPFSFIPPAGFSDWD